MIEAAIPPKCCGVAFKEWAGVCAALGDGRQALILRKGGIAEGPGGFAPDHPAFWLYPTRVHEADQGLKSPSPPDPGPAATDAVVELRSLAVVASVRFADREGDLAALDGLHVWTAETVARRFHYRRPGLWVLGVRVYRMAEPVAIAVTPDHAGCKTWVPLDPPPGTDGARPVLDEGEFAERMARIAAALDRGP